MPKIAFISHGKIKRIDRIMTSFRSLLEPTHKVYHYITTETKRSNSLAKIAIEEGCTNLISIGGDGSLNEVINGVMDLKNSVDTKLWDMIKIGSFPQGTGNDFARTVKLSKSIDDLAEKINEDQYIKIDLGLLTYTSHNGQKKSRYFNNIADVGIGGTIIEKINKYPNYISATLGYQWAILSTLLTYKTKKISATIDSSSYSDNILSFIIAKGKYFGGGLGIAPEASVDNGAFSIVILGNISLLTYLKNLAKVQKCQKINHPAIMYRNASEVHLDSTLGPLPIDMDGEFVGFTPLFAKLIPGAIKLIA